MDRSAPVFFLLSKAPRRKIAVVWLAVLLSACAYAGPLPHPNLEPTWRDYLALPAERALAVAGDPRGDRWVTGYSGGNATRDQAEAEALLECQRLRGFRRLQAQCLLYAVGDEIVWEGN